jgi:hypothetical protein
MKTKRVESFEKRNGSGYRQLLSSRPSNLFKTCLSELKWKLFMAEIAVKLRWWEAKEESIRKNHCTKGFHKLVRVVSSVSSLSCDGKTSSAEYLKCLYCDFIFFSTIKDKRTYLALTSSHRKRAKNMWKELK